MADTPSFSLEDQLTELRTLVESMQKGMSNFDEQLALFQKGMKMIESCRDYLDQTEMQVQQLIDGKLQAGSTNS
ncbi:MAG: exodeoxyribonuclease VII small subunit [Bacteroidota bacterium]